MECSTFTIGKLFRSRRRPPRRRRTCARETLRILRRFGSRLVDPSRAGADPGASPPLRYTGYTALHLSESDDDSLGSVHLTPGRYTSEVAPHHACVSECGHACNPASNACGLLHPRSHGSIRMHCPTTRPTRSRTTSPLSAIRTERVRPPGVADFPFFGRRSTRCCTGWSVVA